MIGIGAVEGLAMAEIYVIKPAVIKNEKHYVEGSEQELRRFLAAKETAAEQLINIMSTTAEELGTENAEIFDYQLLMLEDEDFVDRIRNLIQEEKVSAEYAVSTVAEEYIELFKNIDNDYLRERTSDIEDLEARLLSLLDGSEPNTLSAMDKDVIVAAIELTPSQTACINKTRVKGIILEKGGASSHSVIIARSLGIPCIVGIPDLLDHAAQGVTAIINGATGEVFLSPEESKVQEFKEYQNLIEIEQLDLNRYVNCESKTTDGFPVRVYANITGQNEVSPLIRNGGEGVGLLRTEFIYMTGTKPPSEEIQFGIYSDIAKSLGGKPLIIRTLDAGGDKAIPYLKFPKEDNPFLGFRAIRYCLENRELFKAQISAALRAGQYGRVELMVPMISTVEELREVKNIVLAVKNQLRRAGTVFDETVRLGMMVETPAAAMLADKFAKEVDFFSIGTNDLTQYLFAADRMNEKVAHLNSYYAPALLKTVSYVCRCANEAGIEVDICGQAGEIPELVPVWIGMGITNLSVSIPSILKVRRLICRTNRVEAAELVDKLLDLHTAKEVENYLISRRDENKW